MIRSCQLIAIAATLLLHALSAAAAVTSTSSLVVDGGDFHKTSLALTTLRGDWFVTAKDASVTFTLSTAPGPNAARLEIAWNGVAPQQTITAQSNTLVGGEATFFLFLPGTNCKPARDEAVAIKIATLTSLDINAHLSGAISCNGKPGVTLDGAIRVHRDTAPAPQLSGAYVDCDPVIRDKLTGAEYRSPSDCEIKFVADLRRTIFKALQPAFDALMKNGWILEPLPLEKPVTGVGRKIAQSPFRPDFTTNNRLQFRLRLNPASAEAQRYQQAINDVTARMGDVLKSQNAAAAGQLQKDMERAGREQAGATSIKIGVNVNYPMAGESNFSTQHTILQQPGTTYAIHMAEAQPPAGGASGEEASFLYLGAWSAPVLSNMGAGEALHMNAVFNRAVSTLAVQNISIRIVANAALADAMMKKIDYAALAALLHR